MRITGVHIYGYGKWENVKFMPFSKEIQAIFGQNEAGKSTMMSFIHSILFGFPTKQQNIKRYEPKTALKYGGKLFLDTETFGSITVERIKSTHKATGDVTVTLPDGKMGGEEILTELFKGMDRLTYQRIYSFDIHGIQKVHTIKSDDLGTFLFSAGMIGTDVITNVDQMLKKQLEKYFKPNGKKPLINEKLREVKNVHHQLIKLQEHNNRYNELIVEKERLEGQLLKIDEEKEQLTAKWKLAETKKSFVPLFMEKSILQHKLAQLPKYEPFPIDGLNRIEKLKASMLPFETRKFALETKKMELTEQLKKIHLNQDIIQLEPIIDKLLSTKSLFDAKREEIRSVETEIEGLNEEIAQQKALVNMNGDDEKFLTLNTSMIRNEQIQKLVKQYGQLETEKQLLDDEFSKVKDELETCEAKMKDLEEECLNEHERETYEKIVARYEGKEGKELDSIANSLMTCEKRIKTMTALHNKRKKITSSILLIGWLICFGVMLYSIFSKQYFAITISVILAIILFFFRSSSPYKMMLTELEEERHLLLERQQKLHEDFLMSSNETSLLRDAQKKLVRDDQVKHMLETEKIILKQKEVMYEKIIRSYEEWEKNWFELHEQVEKLKNEYFIPRDVSGNQLFDVFRIIEKIKELIHKRDRLHVKYMQLETDITKNMETIKEISSALNIEHSNENDVFVLMKQLVNEEKEKQTSYISLKNKLREVEEELSLISNEYNHLQSECKKLFEQAEVMTEEAFLAKGKSFKEAEELIRKLQMIDGQLSFYQHLHEVEHIETEAELTKMMKEYSEQLNLIKEQEKEIQTKLSDMKYKISQLEEGGDYSTILQTFTLEKSQLQELYRKWAVYAVAYDLLFKTVNVFKNERLPAIIKEVERNLFVLTNGEYVKVFAPIEHETFIVERNDGMRFTPDELSQATAEQLYIALRFALAQNMQTKERYPIMIDDSFVNFDKSRTECAFRLIRELSQKHQIFFFSCHQHLEHYFNDYEMMNL